MKYTGLPVWVERFIHRLISLTGGGGGKFLRKILVS